MEKYRLVEEHKADASDDLLLEPNTSMTTTATTMTPTAMPSSDSFPEVKITHQGKPRSYISYAMTLFSDGSPTIVLKAMGRAINKAVTIAEILKRKMPLHQLNLLSSVEMVDVYEPMEEGLDVVTSRRYVSCMKITLSKTASGLDLQHPGYQPPLMQEEMSPGDHYHAPEGRGRTRAHQRAISTA